MIPPKRFDIFPPDWGTLRRSSLDALVQIFLYYTTTISLCEYYSLVYMTGVTILLISVSWKGPKRVYKYKYIRGTVLLEVLNGQRFKRVCLEEG